MMERRLVYLSWAQKGLTLDDLDAILASAQAFNSKHDVTGALFYNGASFLQVLEGPDEAINKVLARVQGDDRHGKLKVMEDVREETRTFPDWNMHLFYVPPPGSENKHFSDRLGNYFNDMPTNAPRQIKRLINNFDAVSL